MSQRIAEKHKLPHVFTAKLWGIYAWGANITA